MIRKTITSATLAGLIALPLIAGAGDANASCASRKATGTVIGGVGGALVGNSIAHGGGGAIIGGLGGAVLGHEIARSGCRTTRHASYNHSRSHYASNTSNRGAPQQYYDERGNLVTPAGYNH
jgi:hypothetical protein